MSSDIPFDFVSLLLGVKLAPGNRAYNKDTTVGSRQQGLQQEHYSWLQVTGPTTRTLQLAPGNRAYNKNTTVGSR